ncbi:MAG: SGNH/GDSL hydrolase family protein [Pseudomonadota bacterium]
MPLTFGLPDWRATTRNNPDVPLILCFGDSWVQYPFPQNGNLCNRFLDFGESQAMDIVALGESGMEIADPGKSNLYSLNDFLKFDCETVDMIIVSGGGNDFAGADDLLPLLKVGNTNDVASWFKATETADLFARVTRGYERIIHLRNTYCKNVPIVTHCYDYAPPTGRGLLVFSPWIRPSLDQIGMPREMQAGAVRYIIDNLAKVQQSLANTPAYFFVDTRNTLQAEDWQNELHPSRDGFNKIAAKFYPVISTTFPNWVRRPRWMQ